MIDKLFNHSKFFSCDPSSIPQADLENLKNWLTKEQSNYGVKRKLDFLAGRYCAIMACLQYDFNLRELPINANRSAQWPIGFVGSITHTDGFALAAVSTSLRGLGVDAERLISQERFENIQKMIASEQELEILRTNVAIAPTLLFSAKETLYKALAPLCQQYFGFLEASLISFDENIFCLQLHSENSNVCAYNGHYQGNYTIVNNLLITVLELP
jgi:enterobactin synthetase component D